MLKMQRFPDNLGLATDLLLHTETGIVESRDDYIVVRTPGAPEYFFGNMLVLRQRPSASDLKLLEHDFGQLVGIPPLIAHRTFAWPENADSEVTLDAFLERGYDATVCRVLMAHPDEVIQVATNPLVGLSWLQMKPIMPEQYTRKWVFGSKADWPARVRSRAMQSRASPLRFI